MFYNVQDFNKYYLKWTKKTSNMVSSCSRLKENTYLDTRQSCQYEEQDCSDLPSQSQSASACQSPVQSPYSLVCPNCLVNNKHGELWR